MTTTVVPPQRLQVLVGSYTESLPHVEGTSRGIAACNYDEMVVQPDYTIELRNPSWITLSRSGERLYAVVETDEFEGRASGGVASFARDAATGRWALLNTAPSHGTIPAHMTLDPTERHAIVANYGDGSVSVFGIESDGSLGELSDRAHHVGPDGIKGHPHQVVFDPVSGLLFVPDLGLDAVVAYELTYLGELKEHVAARVQFPPGAGPRHLAFHPDGVHLFVLNEHEGMLCLLRRRGAGFELIARSRTIPDEYRGSNLPSAVRVSHDGRNVYTANRGHDSIACFTFVSSRSMLEILQFAPCHGRAPRDFILVSDGERVHVANQDSNTIATFDRLDDGRLEFRNLAEVPTPACLVIAA